MQEFRDNKCAKLNSKYSPPDKIQYDRRKVYDRYHYMKAGRIGIDGTNQEAKWDKWMKQYTAWRPNRKADDWQSNITPPFTTTIVEKALSEIVDQTLRPIVIPRGPEDEDKAKLMNYILEYLWDVANGDLELYNSIKQTLILGDTIWHEFYWRDKREVEVLKKLNMEKGKLEFKKSEVFDYDDIYGETVPLQEFFVDPMARTINDGRYKANDCLRRFIMNYDTFQETFKDSIFDQFGDSKHVKPGGDLNYWQFYRPPTGMDKENQVEVLFYWGRRPDKHIIVANDIVLFDAPNPFNHKQLPFVKGSDIPQVDQFYSKGEPALLESIQDELSTLRRMRIDRQHMDLFKMFLVSNRETLDEDEAVVAPSRFMFVDDPANSIKPLEYRDINASAYLEEDRLKQDGKEVTGVSDPQPSQTATEAAIFKEATQRALRLKVWLLSRQLVTGIAKLRVPNIIQFYSAPRVEKIVGEERVTKFRAIRTTGTQLGTKPDGSLLTRAKNGDHFFEISPEMITPIYGGFDYRLSGEPTLPISKPLLQQRISELFQNPVIAAAIESGVYDLGKAADLLLEAHDHDPEKLKPEGQQAPEDRGVDKAKLLEMANVENERMMAGEAIPGTPFATPEHTQVHMGFAESEEFKRVAGANPEIAQIFVKHVLQEEAAQQTRGGGEGGGGQTAPIKNQQSSIMSGESKATQPGKMLGAEGVPPVI